MQQSSLSNDDVRIDWMRVELDTSTKSIVDSSDAEIAFSFSEEYLRRASGAPAKSGGAIGADFQDERSERPSYEAELKVPLSKHFELDHVEHSGFDSLTLRRGDVRDLVTKRTLGEARLLRVPEGSQELVDVASGVPRVKSGQLFLVESAGMADERVHVTAWPNPRMVLEHSPDQALGESADPRPTLTADVTRALSLDNRPALVIRERRTMAARLSYRAVVTPVWAPDGQTKSYSVSVNADVRVENRSSLAYRGVRKLLFMVPDKRKREDRSRRKVRSAEAEASPMMMVRSMSLPPVTESLTGVPADVRASIEHHGGRAGLDLLPGQSTSIAHDQHVYSAPSEALTFFFDVPLDSLYSDRTDLKDVPCKTRFWIPSDQKVLLEMPGALLSASINTSDARASPGSGVELLSLGSGLLADYSLPYGDQERELSRCADLEQTRNHHSRALFSMNMRYVKTGSDSTHVINQYLVTIKSPHMRGMSPPVLIVLPRDNNEHEVDYAPVLPEQDLLGAVSSTNYTPSPTEPSDRIGLSALKVRLERKKSLSFVLKYKHRKNTR